MWQVDRAGSQARQGERGAAAQKCRIPPQDGRVRLRLGDLREAGRPQGPRPAPRRVQELGRGQRRNILEPSRMCAISWVEKQNLLKIVQSFG